MRSTAVPIHEDGHMEIIEEVGEYLEGSPLIPKEKFVRKGRLPPKRPPGGEVDAFGRRLNSSPSAACAVVPDFQTDIQFIEEDVAALDMHITDDVVICNANIRQEIRAGGADDDPFGLSDFMPRSPSASSGIDKKQTSAGAVVSVSTNNNSRVTARSIPFTSTTVSKVSPNPSIGSSNKNDQSSNDSKILSLLDPMSPGMDSCPLPTIGFSPRKAAHSTTSFPSNSKDGGDANRRKSASSQPTLPTIPPATATKVPPALVRATPAANGNGKSTTTTTATRSRVRSDTKQGSANTTTTATATIATTTTTVPAKIPVAPLTHTYQRSQPVPANRHATSAARPAEADPAHGPKDTTGAREKGNAPVMRSRRNSAVDWSSGYAMPSASFLRFTGSGKLKGVEADGNATTTAAATTPKSSAATVTFTDTNTNAVSRTNNNSTLRVRRNSLPDKIRAFEDAIAAHDANALPASSAPGPSARPAAKTAGSSGAAAPTTTPPLLSSSGQEEQSPSLQRARRHYSNRQSRGESSTARDDAAPPHPPATGPSSQKSAPPRNPQSLASSQSATATAAAEPRPSRQPPRCSSTITKWAPPAGEAVPGGSPGEAAEELSKTTRRSQGNSNAATTATTKSGNDDKPKGRRQSNPKAAVRSRIPDMVEV